MTEVLQRLADAYVQATNEHHQNAFMALFSDDAIVDDDFREIRGTAAIEEWCQREIFAANVTLEVLNCNCRGAETVITTIVDGDFDRTGLPDPVVIDHTIREQDGKIVALTCRLAESSIGS